MDINKLEIGSQFYLISINFHLISIKFSGNFHPILSLSMTDGRFTDESEILKNAIKGESSAFGLLYDKYQPPIYRFIYLKVSHREEAEDLTHQVFLSAWQNIGRFENQGLPISSWLYQIARNRVIDHYRTKKHVLDIEDAPSEAVTQHERLDDQVEYQMEIEKVKKHLHKLPADYQDILIMRFVEELSNKEIADITGKNAGAIRVLQHRALKQLKKYIENDER
jgi:RNA polymerase sigma-70 factor (ECF subfamily)